MLLCCDIDPRSPPTFGEALPIVLLVSSLYIPVALHPPVSSPHGVALFFCHVFTYFSAKHADTLFVHVYVFHNRVFVRARAVERDLR